MGIALNLIKEHQGIFPFAQVISRHGTQLKVKILLGFHLVEKSVAFLVCLQIDFHIMLEKFLADIPYQIRLSYLPCPIDKQDFPRFMKEEFL